MKRLLIFFTLLFFCTLNCFGANYKPIPKNLSKQYKVEIEEIIETSYPKTVSEIEKIASEAHNMYLKVLNNKKLYHSYCNNDFDVLIDTPEFYLYLKIIDVTNKYINIKNDDALATDWSAMLYDFLLPYFKDNNIKTEKVEYLYRLTAEKQQKIIQEQENLHKFVYPTED